MRQRFIAEGALEFRKRFRSRIAAERYMEKAEARLKS